MTAFYNENDPHAAAWLRSLIGRGLIAPGVVDERSIEDIAPDELVGHTQCHFFAGIGVWSHALRLADWPDDRPVWTGSCPCQPFSSAGKRGGAADERHLWPAFFHLIEQCRPPVVFGEQVANGDGLAWLDIVRADMDAAGYAVGMADLCAAGFGAPHIRQRLFFVAHAGEGGRAQLGEAWLHADGESGYDAAGCGAAGALGDALRDGCGVGRRPTPDLLDESGTGAVRGFWRDADWISCRDGKARPVEPGSFPLVDGSAFLLGSGSAYEGKSRAGMLKVYGNAIVAPMAAGFIRAAMTGRLA